MMHLVRFLRWFAEALMLGVIGGVALLLLVPVAIGWRPYTVLTGSMRPGVQPGDVVMARPLAVTAAHVGDVITFSDPTREGVLVTHRVRSIGRGPTTTNFETRGDANNTSERWAVATSERLGKVVFVLPKVGRVATFIRNPAGLLILVVLPVLGLGITTVRRIWAEDDDEDDHEEPLAAQTGADR